MAGKSGPEIFLHHALDLLEGVAKGAICAAGIELKDIGTIVANTITGLAIPSLDAKLMNRLDLPASVERLPIFGLGCGGGVRARAGQAPRGLQFAARRDRAGQGSFRGQILRLATA
jgi:alkylresorcinol/alkylpyrone synthase